MMLNKIIFQKRTPNVQYHVRDITVFTSQVNTKNSKDSAKSSFPNTFFQKSDNLMLSQHIMELQLISSLTSVKGKPVKELFAVDNTLTINNNEFYKIRFSDNLNHIWSSSVEMYEDIKSELGFSSLEPETLGVYNSMDRFLGALVNGHGSTLRTDFTNEERLDNFAKLGIKTDAWVTINSPNGKGGKFYLDKNGNPWSEDQIESARSAWNNYDYRKDGLTEDSVLTINGKEYRIDENGHFNIPKGEPVIYSGGYVTFPKEMGGRTP